MPRPEVRFLDFKPTTIAYPIMIVLAMWGVYWFELKFGYNFNDWGVRPRTLVGLRGIIFSPFIHGSGMHILNNSLPIILLGVALFYFYEGIAWKVLIFGALSTGFLTWLIARGHSTHIGASGVAYLLFSFLFFKGILSKNFRLIALSLIVVFAYGSLVWGMFPNDPKISWEGHLSGFISGLIFAFVYKRYTIEAYKEPIDRPIMSAREAEFLRHFDEDGNFVPSSEMEHSDEQDNSMDVEVEYEFKPIEIKVDVETRKSIKKSNTGEEQHQKKNLD